MVDLSQYPDDAFDLVYSGQSIEHVAEAEADHVLAEVHRVLRPGGFLALDTPNGRVTRMQQPEFVDPDHEAEYTFEQLREKLERAGFTILDAKGLNYAGASIEQGAFRLDDVIAHPGLFSEARDCYILAFLCTTAAPASARSAEPRHAEPRSGRGLDDVVEQARPPRRRSCCAPRVPARPRRASRGARDR